MKEALLYKKLKGKSVQCGVCQRRCVISNCQTGYCKTRVNKEGKLYSTVYGLVSAINNDPIEKKPVFHYKPGSMCFSLGTFGCNFQCQFCQNWEIAHADARELKTQNSKLKTEPQEVIKMARKCGSSGIAITYNEPAIWLEYSLDIFKLAKACFTSEELRSLPRHLRGGGTPPLAGRHLGGEPYTVWVTNGYATKETIDLIAPYLDVYRVDLKSFADNFYQKLINVPQAQVIFDTTKYLHDQYPKIHIECVTNIIPTWNDSEDNSKKIANWIVKNLGEKTPWHVTRFFPSAQLTNVPSTPPETLFRAREIGLKEGLKFVYIGNMEVDKEDDTFCPKCQRLVIKRDGHFTQVLAVTREGNCQNCDYNLNIIT